MTSLPPHANVPAIAQFLDEDEAASLTEALLQFVETDSGSNQLLPGACGDLASESRIGKPPVLIHQPGKRVNPIQIEPAEPSLVARDSEIDDVRRQLRAAIPDVVTEEAESENIGSVSEAAVEVSDLENSAEQAGVFFFDRTPAAGSLSTEDAGVHSQAEFPTRVSNVVKGFLGRKFSESRFTERDAETDQIEDPTVDVVGRSGISRDVEQPSLATVAGSGFSEVLPSETIAGSGGPPAQSEDESFSWICAERAAGTSRLGFDSEELGEQPGAVGTISRRGFADVSHLNTPERPGCSIHQGPNDRVRRLGSPLLVSSDLAGIQTFRTRGLKLRDLSDDQTIESDPDRLLAAAISLLDLHKKDKAVAAMAAVAIISVGIFGWVAFSYISDWSDASANLRQSLLFGPLVLRSSAIGQSSSFALASIQQQNPGSVPVAPNPVSDRLATTARFVVTPLATGGGFVRSGRSASYLVDLPQLETVTVRGRTPGSPSAVNTKSAIHQPKHRDRRPMNTPDRSVVNRRVDAPGSRQTKSRTESVLAIDSVVADAIARLETGLRRIRN